MKKLLLPAFLLFSLTLVNAQNWNQIQKIVASDRAATNEYGFSVSLSGEYAIIGAHKANENDTGGMYMSHAGAAYIMHIDSSGYWSEIQKIVASDRAPNDELGSTVAISGNYAIAGACHESEDTSGGNTLTYSGSAYIFEENANGQWLEAAKIVASDRAANDFFGTSVAISGNTAIAGAANEDEDAAGANPMSQAGSAYIFERDTNGYWLQVQKIVASDRSFDDRFGYSVAISGNYIIAGAYNEKEDAAGANTMPQAGSAYIFERDTNGNWIQVKKIVASDRAAGDHFANAVAISNNYIIVGAEKEDHDTSGNFNLTEAGSAYIFERDGGGNWQEVQKIVASDRGDYDYFGHSVSVDDSYAVVGAFWETEDLSGSNYMVRAGSAYIFGRDISGNWHEAQKIVASDRGEYDLFGASVSISGKNIIAGAYQEEEDAGGSNNMYNAGSAYIFDGCMTNGMISDTACQSYTSPSGNHIYTNSGVYMDTISNAAGCDSVIVINLTVNTVDTGVNLSGPTLFSYAAGAAYQWLDCNNGYSIIAGAVYQSFSPVVDGIYAVEVTMNNCTDTSACYAVIVSGNIEIDFGRSITVFPNPTSGLISIDLGELYASIDVHIRNISGQLVSLSAYKNIKTFNLNIEGPSGEYLIEIQSQGSKSIILKVFKQ